MRGREAACLNQGFLMLSFRIVPSFSQLYANGNRTVAVIDRHARTLTFDITALPHEIGEAVLAACRPTSGHDRHPVDSDRLEESHLPTG